MAFWHRAVFLARPSVRQRDLDPQAARRPVLPDGVPQGVVGISTVELQDEADLRVLLVLPDALVPVLPQAASQSAFPDVTDLVRRAQLRAAAEASALWAERSRVWARQPRDLPQVVVPPMGVERLSPVQQGEQELAR